MLSAIEIFRENILRVRSLGGIAGALTSMTTAAVDCSDLLRAQIVLTLSAFDHYVHEVTRLGMLEIFDGKRVPSGAYLRFKISLDNFSADNKFERQALESEIRIQHGFLPYQHPEKVADAIRHFSDVKIWETVASRLGTDAGQIKQRLRLCAERRNKIAHEADLDPTYPNIRWPISAKDVDDVVICIVDIVEAIHVEIS
jgi:hypothetical protein